MKDTKEQIISEVDEIMDRQIRNEIKLKLFGEQLNTMGGKKK